MTKSTLTGILVPDQWTEDGKISGFALCTDDEQKYVLNCTVDKKYLLEILHQTIVISGVVIEDALGKIIIATGCCMSFQEKQETTNPKINFRSGVDYLEERARIENFCLIK